MYRMTQLGDKLAIGLSLMCAIHCLVLPIVIIALPSLIALGLDNEIYHKWMIYAVIPTSLYALSMGCRQHKKYRLFAMGFIGMTLLFLAVFLGESAIGELGEKLLTLSGAVILAAGHFYNFKLCQHHNKCCSHTHN